MGKETGTITTEQQYAEDKKERKREQYQEALLWQSVLNTPDGRKVIGRMLDDCGCGIVPPVAYVCDETGRMVMTSLAAHVERQHLGKQWIEAMLLLAPDQFRIMQQERLDATIKVFKERFEEAQK